MGIVNLSWPPRCLFPVANLWPGLGQYGAAEVCLVCLVCLENQDKACPSLPGLPETPRKVLVRFSTAGELFSRARPRKLRAENPF